MSKKKILFIVNPFAGYNSNSQLPQLIEKEIPKDQFDTDIINTEYAGHAIELTREALKENIDAIIAVGGDGTVNEVASELVNQDMAMGIIPAGSGNGLSMHLGIGRNARKALSRIIDFNVQQIDTAKVNDQVYVNMAGFGIDGLVAYKTKLNSKRGFSTYFKGAIMEGLKYKNQSYKVEIDGESYEGKFLSVNVANGSMFGYNFYIAPQADTSDGMVDTLIIHDAHKVDYFGNAWRFWAKRIHRSKLASMSRTTSLRITTYEDSHMHIDGEGYPCKAGEYHFMVMPESLKIIC